MSDHSTATLVIYEVPPDQEAALRAAVNDSDERPGEWPDEDEPLTLGEHYYVEECSLDANETLADDIIDAAPGATFAVWVDPKYEYQGVITAYTPARGLGRFDGVCTSDGDPYVTLGELERLPDLGKLDGGDPLSDALARILGKAWFDHIAAIRPATETAVAS